LPISGGCREDIFLDDGIVFIRKWDFERGKIK
jgi:hypothetical protein